MENHPTFKVQVHILRGWVAQQGFAHIRANVKFSFQKSSLKYWSDFAEIRFTCYSEDCVLEFDSHFLKY